MTRVLFIVFLVSANPLMASAGLFVEDPIFRQCQEEAFIAQSLARDAMRFGETRESMLGRANVRREFQVQAIDQLFDEIGKYGSKDHNSFAARTFQFCAKRESLPRNVEMSKTRECFVGLDVIFHLTVARRSRTPMVNAIPRVKRWLSEQWQVTYPPALFDELGPIVYRASSPEDDSDLQQTYFLSCLFRPDFTEWCRLTKCGRK